jgi:hypothetical protein
MPQAKMLCSAQEISELITKLLNKLYTQQDFKIPVAGAAPGKLDDTIDADTLLTQELGKSGQTVSAPLENKPKPSDADKSKPRNPDAISLELAAPAVLKT